MSVSEFVFLLSATTILSMGVLAAWSAWFDR
jgi:hypothetical protein